ncbi:hypothetical protein MBLNU230_g4408t1 [Neophaeotheca triangularis]
MRNILTQLLAIGPELASFILSSPLLFASGANAQTPETVPSPDLDLRQLGRVALAGNFDTISLYTYQGQNEQSLNLNGSQSLLTRYPNGDFYDVALTDAHIHTMCPFVREDGDLAGVMVGGNFTSLGGQRAQSIALYNPENGTVKALPGLRGRVNAVYCDEDSGTVYVGGSLMGSDSTNAITWTSDWTNLPFAGFNGEVTSITKNAAGNIVFGGAFDGLGNTTTTPDVPDAQVINLGSGNVTANGSTDREGYSDPRNIICSTSESSGEGEVWLLADDTPGYWQGEYGFGFNPTKLRLYNTQIEGRGTESWYFENLNSGGIMALNYTNPQGETNTCYSQCPLPEGNSTYQDFYFVPPVGMDGFRIHITSWYGAGGGLSGVELFHDAMTTYAIDSFNSPECDVVGNNGSSSTVSPEGLWTRTPNNGLTDSDYLTAFATNGSALSNDTFVTFTRGIQQAGNYTITIFTPGCIQDDSCDTRGIVAVTVQGEEDSDPVTTQVYQTNNYAKMEQIYSGPLDVSTDDFSPTVTIAPAEGQEVPLTIVAQRLDFNLTTTTGGLNGLFEYDPSQDNIDTDFSNNTIDAAGMSLDRNAQINALATYEDRLLVVGNFSGDDIQNVMVVEDDAESVAGGGLNNAVACLYQNGDDASTIYMGGNFTSTADDDEQGLNHVAVYSISDDSWSSLGAGVDGPVTSIVPLMVNITSDDPAEECIAITGDFDQINGFDDNDDADADGFAIWVPSQENWLANIEDSEVTIRGELVAFTNVPDSDRLYAGQIISETIGLSGAVELVGSDSSASLESLGIQISVNPSSSAGPSRKRAIGPGLQNYTGVVDGQFYGDNGLNITILGGQFTATGSDGSTVENLAFINNTADDQTITGVDGLDSDSMFLSSDTYETMLFAGGAISGTINDMRVNGLIVYDLEAAELVSPHPPALQGDEVVVNVVATRPGSSDVYVGGSFNSAGSLSCGPLCAYDTEAQQWNSPGSGLSGVIYSMVWSSSNQLIIIGDLSVGGNETSMATYDAEEQEFAEFADTSSLPGQVTVATPGSGDYDSFWAAGSSSEHRADFLAKYTEEDSWTTVDGLAEGTSIRGLQVLSLDSDHDSTDLLDDGDILLVTGNIVLPDSGNCSAALFNGTSFQPFLLTSTSDGSPGSISRVFVENPDNLMNPSSSSNLALGFVVLIGLAISLALIMILVLIGLLAERWRRRREGYVPMSSSMERSGNLDRIPPETLFQGLEEKEKPPRV